MYDEFISSFFNLVNVVVLAKVTFGFAFPVFQQRNGRINKNHAKHLDFLLILHAATSLAQPVLY
jgi:hypothetical protein